MGIGCTLPYVYGEYLMNPQIRSSYNNVNKNSFGRLMNCYYGKHSLYKKTLPVTNASGFLEFNEEVKELQESLGTLTDKQTLYKEGNEETLKEALTVFVEEYNAVRESFEMLGSEEFHGKGNIVDTVAKAHEEELSRIGLVQEENGTFTIGENGLSVSDLEEVKALFQGKNSFASHLKKKSERLGQEALSLLSPVPKFYGESGSINYVVSAGTLFSTCC